MSRLMEEPALKRLKEKSASLEHFKVDQSAVTVVEEKPIEEYTLPHPIWSQVLPFTYSLSKPKPGRGLGVKSVDHYPFVKTNVLARS